MKSFKGTTYIQRLAHDGRGVAEIEGRTAFIFGGLPEEQVTVEVYRQHKRYFEGSVLAVAAPSAHRVEPKCVYFGICGGCRLQHLSLVKQQEHKQQVVLDLLKHLAGVVPQEVAPTLAVNSWGYRHKARLGVRFVPKKGGVLVGFRERKSNKLTSLKHCDVLHPKIGTCLEALRLCFEQLSAREHISQVEVAVTTLQTVLIIRHLVPLTEEDQAILIAFAKEQKFSLYLQSGGPATVKPLWPSVPEALFYELPELGLKLNFHPLDFIQVDPVLNQAMVSQALEWLAPSQTENALDLFCGVGNFSLAMAKGYGTVYGFEVAATMVARASANALENQLDNVSFVAADLSKPLSLSLPEGLKIDAVLLDPPRSGALEIIPKIAQLQPKRILYVSCNPATFSRDAGVLVREHGYQLKKIGIMDMFVHTEHIETMALFVKD